MAVMSFLAFAQPGQLDRLISQITHFDGCEAEASTTHEVAIVVAEAGSDEAMSQVQRQLEQLDSLQGLAMVAAYSDQVYLGGEV